MCLYHITVYTSLIPLIDKVKMAWKNFCHNYWHSLWKRYSPRYFLLLGIFHNATSTTQLQCCRYFCANFKDFPHPNLHIWIFLKLLLGRCSFKVQDLASRGQLCLNYNETPSTGPIPVHLYTIHMQRKDLWSVYSKDQSSDSDLVFEGQV